MLLHVIKGILTTFLEAFAVSDHPEHLVWYRRYLPLVVLIAAVLGGILAWTLGTSFLVGTVVIWFGLSANRDVSPGVHGALVVAWLGLLGSAITVANLGLVARGHEPLIVTVPRTLHSWIAGAVGFAVGALIGTTIFT